MLGPDPLGLVNKGSLLALGQQLPLRPQPLGDLCSVIVIIRYINKEAQTSLFL